MNRRMNDCMTHSEPQATMDAARWQAQEKARRGDADADPEELRIAQALRRAPAVALSVDFASQVAALARARAVASTVLEQRLLQALVGVLTASAVLLLVLFGRSWLLALSNVLPGGRAALAWSCVAALCLLGNWAMSGLRRHVGTGQPHPA